jgi:hypothetical protein
MIDTDKYEGLIDAEGYIDYDGLDHLLAEVKRLREVIKKIKECATINAQHDDILEKQEWEYILEMIE